jgi:CheY-like chemotaxis protein
MAVAIDNARLHRATEEARAEAERANRAKDEFLAMLGHELRNPLSPIVTALQLLKLRRAGAGSGRELEVIDRQVHHLVRLVDDLLDVSRITRGKVSLDRARVELADVVAKAVEMAAPLVEQQAHTLVVSVPATGLPVDGDRDRLAQVIANLLTNAAKYTPRGGHIWIRGEREDGQVVVRVRDDGSGIPPELLPRMFDLFVQGERSSERSQGGLGIGLSLVRSLVELHGGSVSARSDGLGEGTEVAVRLPVAAAVAPTSEPPATRPAARAATSRRVLVVDDNRDAAQLLGETLRDVGYDVTIAFDPAEALTAARHAPPEVAILDIGLPVMDGVELAERLRQELPGEPPRFVAVTGYGQPSDRSRTAAAGFAAHLVKPIDVETLVRVIEGTPPPVDGGVR